MFLSRIGYGVLSRRVVISPATSLGRIIPKSVIINGGLIGAIRQKSNLPQDFNPKKTLPSQGEWKHLKQHIPGESIQTNEVKERVPKFPLAKEIVPTLLPKPGVPQVGPKYSFRQVLQILKTKTEPELIYESEPHRLYFLTCFCCGIVFAIYGLVLGEYAWFQAGLDYEENVEEKNEVLRKREWVFSLLKNSIFSIVMLTAAYGVFRLPTKLIRRIWYLPGRKEHIQFTSYPLIPGRPTPVVTTPLENLTRRKTARVWTGKGFYGTADNSMFFFILREKLANGRSKNWMVDRKGFFWSDGRVFDYLFGKESVEEAEAGIPYDEQIGIINREVKKKKKQLREKHGRFYQFKIGAQDLKEDVSKATNYVKSLKQGNNKKELPKGQENNIDININNNKNKSKSKNKS
ncbi:uncharacterized protein RJT21DRAFT_98734, partial [Scheffersomyces amazonensis]|uniref:uncharacterized protein n=1 Tax=Scheffersomyces amazonensis TaxID=1078765 RepID=UPI00315DC134